MVEVQVKEPLRIEVFPAGSDVPVLVKERNFDYKPAPAISQIVPINRESQFPSTLSKKQALQFEQNYRPKATAPPGEWKTIDVEQVLNETGVEGARKGGRVSPLINTEGGQALGSFLTGIIDEFRGSSAEHAYQHYGHLQDPGNKAFYDTGRQAAQPLERFIKDAGHWAKDELNNVFDDLKNHIHNLPNIQIPLPRLPNIKLPNVKPPEIHLPEIHLPEIHLPGYDYHINNPEDEDEKERQKRKEEEEKKKEQDKNKPTIDHLYDLLNNYPYNCRVLISLVRHQYQTYPSKADFEGHSGNYTYTSWMPGRGRIKPLHSEQDKYGNTIYEYPNGGGVGYGLYYGFEMLLPGNDELDQNNTICVIQTAVAYISKYKILRDGSSVLATPFDWFSAKDSDDKFYCVINDFNQWEIDGYSVVCDFPPNNNPYLSNNYPLLPPEPPKGDDSMTGCDCNSIADVMRKTLKSMKFRITIPVVSCNFNENLKEYYPAVDNQTIEIFAVDAGVALSQAKLYQEIAIQARELCLAKNLLNKTSKIIGVDDYPVNVPQTLITKDGNNPENEDIPTLTQLLTKFIRYYDETIGQWEVPIEIKDVDPTQEGDQSKTLKFPNIAELLAELMMVVMQLSINSELHTNIAIRTLTETGQDKKQNFITYKGVESIIDFLGYKIKNKEVKLPMLFTPDKTGFEDILKECELPVSISEYDEELTLQSDLLRFREAAAIIKANNFTKLDPGLDIAEQIMKRLLSLSGLLKDSTSESTADDFDEFLSAVEQGFTNSPGVGDPAHPYNRPYEERPRIKRIKKPKSTD